MKKKYIFPQTCGVEMLPEYIIAQSSLDGSGTDYGDPIIIGDSDFNY